MKKLVAFEQNTFHLSNKINQSHSYNKANYSNHVTSLWNTTYLNFIGFIHWEEICIVKKFQMVFFQSGEILVYSNFHSPKFFNKNLN
jgi:hypothetical protein